MFLVLPSYSEYSNTTSNLIYFTNLTTTDVSYTTYFPSGKVGRDTDSGYLSTRRPPDPHPVEVTTHRLWTV